MSTDTKVRYSKGPPRLVGHVFTQLRITNARDHGRMLDGTISKTDIRSVTLDHVLIDTGATHLCLPIEIIDKLGLDGLDIITLKTAAGAHEARMFEGARLEMEGRVDTFSCVELPEGSDPLVGVVPLEVLGLEPNLAEHTLRVLPRRGKETYILAY